MPEGSSHLDSWLGFAVPWSVAITALLTLPLRGDPLVGIPIGGVPFIVVWLVAILRARQVALAIRRADPTTGWRAAVQGQAGINAWSVRTFGPPEGSRALRIAWALSWLVGIGVPFCLGLRNLA